MEILNVNAVTHDEILGALTEVRDGRRVTDQNRIFDIEGVDKTTGEEWLLCLEAADEESAVAAANGQNILVSSIKERQLEPAQKRLILRTMAMRSGFGHHRAR